MELYFELQKYNRIRILEKAMQTLIGKGAEEIVKFKKDIIHARASFNEFDLRYEANRKKQELIESLPTIEGRLTMQFVYEGNYYYISHDDNPFFPVVYGKIRVDKEGNYTGRRIYSSSETNDLHAFRVEIFGILTEEEINAEADRYVKAIEDIMFNGFESPVMGQRHRIYHSRGYSYETIYNKEKFNVYKKF